MKRSTMGRWLWIVGIVLVAILAIVELMCSWSWLPGEYSPIATTHYFWRCFRGEDSLGTAVRNVVLVLATLIAVPLAVWRSIIAYRQAAAAQNQLELAERDSLDARYQKGADMLSSENISTRIGGVYALKRLAENHPERFHIQVMELLCAFVRHPPKAKDSEESDSEDFTAALETIIHRSDDAIAIEEASRRTPKKAGPGPHRASEEGFRVNLKGAMLEEAILHSAKLRGAILDHAKMSGIWCEDADFSDTSMSGCIVNNAVFGGTVFDNVRMTAAEMSNAHFENCSFVKTVMCSSLSKSVFKGSNLTGARFRAANLKNTNLENADLSGAKFEKVGERTKNTTAGVGTSQDEHFCKLTQRQLDSAMANPDDPPYIEEGTIDIETGKPIVWNHKLCGYRWLEHQKSRDSM